MLRPILEAKQTWPQLTDLDLTCDYGSGGIDSAGRSGALTEQPEPR